MPGSSLPRHWWTRVEGTHPPSNLNVPRHLSVPLSQPARGDPCHEPTDEHHGGHQYLATG